MLTKEFVVTLDGLTVYSILISDVPVGALTVYSEGTLSVFSEGDLDLAVYTFTCYATANTYNSKETGLFVPVLKDFTFKEIIDLKPLELSEALEDDNLFREWYIWTGDYFETIKQAREHFDAIMSGKELQVKLVSRTATCGIYSVQRNDFELCVALEFENEFLLVFRGHKVYRGDHVELGSVIDARYEDVIAVLNESDPRAKYTRKLTMNAHKSYIVDGNGVTVAILALAHEDTERYVWLDPQRFGEQTGKLTTDVQCLTYLGFTFDQLLSLPESYD